MLQLPTGNSLKSLKSHETHSVSQYLFGSAYLTLAKP